MAREEKNTARTLALIIAAVVLILHCLDIPLDEVGLSSDAPCYTALTYSFFHVSFLHAALNAWCLLSLVFGYGVSLNKMLIAYIIAILCPATSDIPTVGLSGVCFALIGMVSVGRNYIFLLFVAAILALGFFFPQSNGWLHLLCYLAGLIVGLLNMPIRR